VNYTAAQRKEMAKNGQALPDGSYPIKTRQDIENAIRLSGQGNAPQHTVIMFIIKRAKALNALDLIPKEWAPHINMAQSDKLEDVLAHFGVKGMKWGIRKSQARSIGRNSAAAARGLKKDPTKTEFHTQVGKAGGLHKVSDKQLKSMLARMEMERKFTTMMNEEKVRRQRGLAAAGKVLLEVGKIALPVILAGAGAKVAADRGVFRTTAHVVGKRVLEPAGKALVGG
jgi:hypothetical protein